MTRPIKLTDLEVAQNLTLVPEWRLTELSQIGRTFGFGENGNFVGAIEFVDAIAKLAEEMQHHPDIDIRYSSVSLHLSTHDAGGLTILDFELAQKIDSAYAAQTHKA
jgi:4a-hydroxytetrahydrobiopterin dehydratase